MIKWLRKILGIADCEMGIVDLEKIVTCQHQSIEAIELAVGHKKLDHFRKQVSAKYVEKRPMRYDEIERDRKRRKKGG
jgi:hypothetical protein